MSYNENTIPCFDVVASSETSEWLPESMRSIVEKYPTREHDNDSDAEIGYILKGYPRLSEIFITNEIHLLERGGVKLRIFAIKKENEKKSHDVVNRIRAQVTYLPKVLSLSENDFAAWLWDTLPKFVQSHWQLFKMRPRVYAQTLSQVFKMCFKYRSGSIWQPKKVFFKEFLQAGYIALEILKSGRIRHLHAHFCHGAANVAMFASRLSGVPFSFTAHAKDIYESKLNPGDLLPVKMHRARFVATCTASNKTHLEGISLNGTPIHTIYHGLNTELFAPARNHVDQSRLAGPLILSVGRLVEKKGFADLLQACRLLKDRGCTVRCQILGEEGEQSTRLKQMIDELQLEDTVSLHREVTHHELREIYKQATVFALPCQIAADGDRDGIPNVLAEAMAMGLPVVSTDISGIPELVTDGVEGLLISQKDVAALADALEKLLTDPALRRQLGIAARAKICEMFDSERNTGALKNLFIASSEFNRGNTPPATTKLACGKRPGRL